MARILVSGGAGYLGSILVPALLDAGHMVTVLDSFKWNQNSLAHVCADGGLEIVRGDARDPRVLEPLLDQADLIIPLAALVGAPLCDADATGAVTTNTSAIQILCRLTKRPIIIPISNSGYGIGEPGKECTEDSPLNPISLYGKTKVEAEQAAMLRSNAISLRLATVFGMSPRMRLDLLVNDFVYRAVTDRAVVLYEARAKRNYIHVRDVARVFLHAIDNFGAMKDHIFNVGLSDANLSKRELCKRIKEHVPDFTFLEAPVGSDPDKRDYVVSNARIEATGWKPAYSLDDGIRELIKGYKMLRNARYGNV
jgi:nucleoside-diphosphate-sugar epimerase